MHRRACDIRAAGGVCIYIVAHNICILAPELYSLYWTTHVDTLIHSLRLWGADIPQTDLTPRFSVLHIHSIEIED